ncbi:MAG: hypothetical protein KAG56_00860 [Sulfurovaceae bacterium]|nr:hypothetical protein [Sulfurovaceae bacterium]
MIELIVKIGFFLAVAMLMGMGIGWFISDLMRKRATLLEAKSLRSTIHARDKQLKALEDNLSIQKTQLYKMTDDGIVSRHNLLKQSNTIRKQSDELYMIQDKLGQIKMVEKDKAQCLQSIMELSLRLKERENQVDEYEKESLLMKNSDSGDKSLSIGIEKRVLTQEIEKLKELLEASRSKLSENDMIISKDQFRHIEKEFVVFNEKIELLEKEKNELTLLLKERVGTNSGLIGKVTSLFSSKNRESESNLNLEFKKQPNFKQV